MNGLVVEKNGNSTICTFSELTDEIKDYIRAELAAICYGSEDAKEDDIYFSYTNTLKEFVDIYSTKTEELQKGIMGELLAHIVMKSHFTSLTSVGVMLNKEEHNIRKGFDLIHVDRNDVSIWYGEVKAGAKPSDKSPSQKARTLIHTAKRDLIDKLTGVRRKLWLTARLDTRLSLLEPRAKNVRSLLIKDVTEINEDPRIKKNAVLTSVLFHQTTDAIEKAEIETVQQMIHRESHFNQVLVISIQKSTIQALEQFFEEESQNA